VGWKTTLWNKCGTPRRAQKENEFEQSLEGFAGVLQSCAWHMWGEDMKGQSSVRVETGQCCI